MKLYFDTSALIKKYINEIGSEKVDELFNNSEIIYVSKICEIETLSTFKRLLMEKLIDKEEFILLKNELQYDLKYFEIVELDDNVVEMVKKMIEKYQIKSLDSIHLGSVKSIENLIDSFIVCDSNLIKCSEQEGIKIINPIK